MNEILKNLEFKMKMKQHIRNSFKLKNENKSNKNKISQNR